METALLLSGEVWRHLRMARCGLTRADEGSGPGRGLGLSGHPVGLVSASSASAAADMTDSGGSSPVHSSNDSAA